MKEQTNPGWPGGKRKRIILVGILVGWVFVFSVPAVLSGPRPVQAATATTAAAKAVVENTEAMPVLDVYQIAKDQMSDWVEKPFAVGIIQIMWNLMQFIANRLAFEFAVSLATGATGGDPLVELRSGEWFAQDIVNDIAGETIASLSDALQFSGINFDLCLPGELWRFNLQLGLREIVRPEPRCEFQDALRNWTTVYENLTEKMSAIGEDPTKAVLTYFANSINPRGTELGASIQLYSRVFEQMNFKKQYRLAELFAGDRYKNITDVITGQVKTPSQLIEDRQLEVLRMNSPEQINKHWFDSMIAQSELWKNLGLSTLSVFSHAFLNTFIERLLLGFYDVDLDTFDTLEVSDLSFRGGVEGAEEFYRSVFVATPISLDTYNAVSEFIVCPETTTPGLYNCVMDTDFATAVGGADSGDSYTVREAIEDDLLRGDWPLISETDDRNLDKDCYSYGYCQSNLIKLRKARVIPVGWEMAAALQGSSPDTLSEIVDAFDDCNADGERDVNYPYCHLIDPNWVLKYPSSQCKAQVPGQLVSNDGVSRSLECVDSPSCIQEDATGACVGGYGYCLAEKNSYLFRGQSCPEQYASCLSFASEDGDEADLLLNTVDSSVCDSENAGCLWYATAQEEDTSDAFDWPTISDVATEDEADNTYRERLYFNDEVETCDGGDAGCRRLVIDNDDVEFNLIENPSFEDDEDSDNSPDRWMATGTITYETDSEVSLSGEAAVNAGSSALYQRNIPIQESHFYTLSFYAAQSSSTASNSLTVYVVTDSMDGAEEPDLSQTSYSSGSCSLADLDGSMVYESLSMSATPTSDEYERFSCVFTSPTLSVSTVGARIAFLKFTGDVLIDAVQLESDEDLDNFREGYGATVDGLPLVFYKLPPDYLGCAGEASDPDECDDYAPICSAQDVGCDMYTPVNGDPSVPGIANDLNECPSECAGYDTFKQEPTRYEPDGEFPVYFIPDTAITCSEQYVGCDEFTDLASEERKYYTYLRACLTDDQTTKEAVYYTWEGSDLEGFQLKSWNLLESDLDEAPCTTWTTTDNTILCADVDSDGDTHADTDETCDEHDDIFNEPDCREFYDAEGDISYRLWSDTVTIGDDCAPYRKTETAGETTSERQSNCEAAGGFWDVMLGSCLFYGLESESNSCPAVQDGCRQYTGGAGRNSSTVFEDDFEDEDIDEYDTDNVTAEVSNESVATDGHSIHLTAGAAAGSVFTAYADMSDCSEADGCDADSSGACDEEDGCDVEDSTLGFACTISEEDSACGVLTDDLVEGKVYILSFWAKAATNGVQVTPAFIYDGGTGTTQSFESVELSTNWESFTVGPLDTTDTDFDETAVLAFIADVAGDEFYLDTITLRQTEEEITVIQDSWETPSTCDETEEGASSPQYHLGCQEYTDADGDTVYLKSFERLCEEEKVGCAAFFDTQGSDSPYGTVYNVTCENADDSGDGSPDAAASVIDCEVDGETVCSIGVGLTSCQFDWPGGEPRDATGVALTPDDTDMSLIFGPEMVTVLPDEKAYFVADSGYACSEAVMGCTAVGVPTFSADKSVVNSWETTYLLNQPEEYDEQLCQSEALWCEAWETTDGSTYYFKNPLDKTCEYQTGVALNGVAYSGWFQSGTTEFCYGTGECSDDSSVSCETDSDCAPDYGTCEITTGSYLSAGKLSGIWRNGDDDFDGWAGKCSATYDQCTAFIDPADVGDEIYGEGDGAAYHYLDNELLDEANLSTSKRCNGKVSQKRGCVLFEDSTLGELNWNASASYLRSVRAADFEAGAATYDLVDPISCPDGGELTLADGSQTVDLCSSRCVYENELLHPYDNYSSASGEELYTFAGSCLTDNDCSDLLSDGYDPVDGSCESGSFTGSDGSTVTVSGLEDDVNVVRKVNLDRACEEWLACDSTTTVWDSSLQAYKISCDSIGACTEYTALGDTTFCAEWNRDVAPTILSADTYARRDTGWYGTEFAGYSIPDSISPALLTQININPGSWCVKLATGEAATPSQLGLDDLSSSFVACEDDTDCSLGGAASGTFVCELVTEQDYRLVYNAGSCDEDAPTGEECAVGFCSDSGAACTSDDDCESGECAVGYCAGFNPAGSYAYSCGTDAECASYGSNDTCIEGYCMEETSYACTSDSECETSYYSTTTGYCIEAVAAMTGACYNEKCLLDYRDGDGDDELDPFQDSASESADCRGWPETDAPFGNEVVEKWDDTVDPSDTPGSSIPNGLSSRAFTRESTFEQVNLCAPEQACDCSYDKMIYSNGSLVMYYDDGADQLSYVCIGGVYDGAECDLSATSSSAYVNSADCEDNGGMCVRRSSVQEMVGWQGYCLERDAAIQINGDNTQDACLTWYPVDRLRGVTDLNGKFVEAGYDLGNTFYCAEVETGFDLRTTEKNHSVNCKTDGTSPNKLKDTLNSTNTFGNATLNCPAGFFGVGFDCVDTTGPSDNYNLFCVPMFSYADRDQDGTIDGSCQIPGDAGWSVQNIFTADSGATVYDLDFNDFADAYSDYYQYCETRGLTYETMLDFMEPYGVISGDNDGSAYWSNDIYDNDSFLACPSLVRVADNENENRAWTNRLWEWKNDSTPLTDPRLQGSFDFLYETETVPFGGAVDPDAVSVSDAYPLRAVACEATEDDFGLEVQILPDSIDICSSSGYPTLKDFDDHSLTGRAFLSTSITEPTLLEGSASGGTHGSNVYFGEKGWTWTWADEYPNGDDWCVNSDCTCSSDSDCNVDIACEDYVCSAGPFENQSCESDGDCQIVQCVEWTSTKTNPIYVGPCESSGVCDLYEALSCYTDSDCTVGSGSREECAVPAYLAESYSTVLPDDSEDRLSQIFAKAIDWFVFDEGEDLDASTAPQSMSFGSETSGSWGDGTTDYLETWWNWDITATGDDDKKPSPPEARAVSSTCFDDECIEGDDDKITINGESDNDLTAEQMLFAKLSFYMEADPDQMPIRRVIIEWGDETDDSDQTGSTADDNFYKNARGLNSSGEEYCGGETDWGTTDDACQTGAVTAYHYYTCSKTLINTLNSAGRTCADSDGDGQYDESPCTDGDSCVFIPRVHVRDNWGWCTGTCPDDATGVDGTNGCYDGDGLIGSSTDGDDECDLSRPDNTTDENNKEDDPWVYFNGAIILEP